MHLRHERKMYPPRVKMTVIKQSDNILKLPVRIEGCSCDHQLDVELTIPLGIVIVPLIKEASMTLFH